MLLTNLNHRPRILRSISLQSFCRLLVPPARSRSSRLCELGLLILILGCYALFRAWATWINRKDIKLPPLSASVPSDSALNTTVIVGAGIAGLSTAYHLADEFRNLNRPCRIIVIDALEDLFGAASRNNSGILSYQWFPTEVQAFGEYTYRLYEDLAENDSNFRKECGYRDHSSFMLCLGKLPSVQGVPNWIEVPDGWYVKLDPKDGRAATV